MNAQARYRVSCLFCAHFYTTTKEEWAMSIVIRITAGQGRNQHPTTFSTFREGLFDELQKRKGHSSP